MWIFFSIKNIKVLFHMIKNIRWMPSTLLNIIDLLGDWKSVTRKNEDVSKIYILYQVNIL